MSRADELASIVADASYLSERMSSTNFIFLDPAPNDFAKIKKRRVAWKEHVGTGNEEKFQARLAVENWQEKKFSKHWAG